MGDENLPQGITREEVERHKAIQRFLALDPDEEEHRSKYIDQSKKEDSPELMQMFQEAFMEGMREEGGTPKGRRRRG